jgi:transcriptional regulator with XRE-family HTH domain
VELRGQFSKSAEIKRDLKAGELTQSAIAKKYGCSRQYVNEIKKKMGGNEQL